MYLFHNTETTINSQSITLSTLTLPHFMSPLSCSVSYCFLFSYDNPHFCVSGCFPSLTLWYYSRDLLINALVVPLLCQLSNKYLELCGTFHQHSRICCFGKSSFSPPSFILHPTFSPPFLCLSLSLPRSLRHPSLSLPSSFSASLSR